jgi:hypothetical protein
MLLTHSSCFALQIHTSNFTETYDEGKSQGSHCEISALGAAKLYQHFGAWRNKIKAFCESILILVFYRNN